MRLKQEYDLYDVMFDDFILNIADSDQGQRLDVYLAKQLPVFSRTRIKALIEQGAVLVDGHPTEPSLIIKNGMMVTGHIPEVDTPIPRPQDIPLTIVYEDDDIIVLNKDAGMVVHPAPGHYDNTLVNALLAHCGESLSGIGGVRRPGLVHRLDKGTSGLMVVAKNDRAHRALALQFSHRSLKRTYKAIVWGFPMPPAGTVENTIGRSSHDWRKRAVVQHGGKIAITDYKVIQNYKSKASLVECQLQTGRTHQIRVHMTHLGYGIIGDPQYGNMPRGIGNDLCNSLKSLTTDFTRPCLHAFRLVFYHPIMSKLLNFETPLPNDMQNVIDVLEKLK